MAANAKSNSGVKKGLGKGLDGIIKNKTGVASKADSKEKSMGESAVKNSAVMIDINNIERNKEQPRKKFDENAINELAGSIKQYGILEPLIVQKKDDHYEIIAGERRWRAAKTAGLKEVPVIIKSLSDQQVMEISLIENIQREDLDVIEEAMAYKRLKQEFHLTDDQVAEKVFKSRAAVTNCMRLLKLSTKVQELIVSGELSMGHARALLAVDGADKQLALAKKIISDQLSVRETEKLIKNMKDGTSSKQKKESKKSSGEVNQYQLQYNEYAEKLSKKLGLKVSINLNDEHSGKMEIDFYNVDDFEKVYGLLKK